MVIRALLVIGPGAASLAAQVQARVEAVAAGAPMRWRRIGPEVTEEEIAARPAREADLVLLVEGTTDSDLPLRRLALDPHPLPHSYQIVLRALPTSLSLRRFGPQQGGRIDIDPLDSAGLLSPEADAVLSQILNDIINELRCGPFTRIEVIGFGPLPAAHIQFSPSLNVIIGENSTGKSWLMKLLYATSRANVTEEELDVDDTLGELRKALVKRLKGLFLPDEGALGRLVRRGAERCDVKVTFGAPARTMTFDLSDNGALTLTAPPSDAPPPTLFIPSRETLAMYEGFMPYFQQRQLSIEETYYDLCSALAEPLWRDQSPGDPRLLSSVEALFGGSVWFSGVRFYRESDGDRVEAHLLSEGLRKIGTLARLIQNGSLRRGSVLFWDEPEANMNPRLLKRLAAALVELAAGGVQVFLATHSLFLLRELHIQRLVHPDGPDARYIGLGLRGAEVVVAQGAELTDLPDIAALDEELDQSDRLMELHSSAVVGAARGEPKP